MTPVRCIDFVPLEGSRVSFFFIMPNLLHLQHFHKFLNHVDTNHLLAHVHLYHHIACIQSYHHLLTQLCTSTNSIPKLDELCVVVLCIWVKKKIVTCLIKWWNLKLHAQQLLTIASCNLYPILITFRGMQSDQQILQIPTF